MRLIGIIKMASKKAYYETKTKNDMSNIITKSIALTINLSDVQPVGSYSQVTLPYWSDIDVNDKVSTTYNNVASELINKFKQLATSSKIHFSDFKTGSTHWNLSELAGLSPQYLAQVLRHSGVIKLDVIFFENNRFIEQSTFFMIHPPMWDGRPNMMPSHKRVGATNCQ